MNKFSRFITIILIVSFCGFIIAACGSGPSSPSGGSAGLGRPAWINNPGSVYPDSVYIVATGSGRDQQQAQYTARVNLLGIFGMKLSDEVTIEEVSQQISAGNQTTNTGTITASQKISASASGILAGAEIKENWNDGREFYALAIMERSKTRDLYTGIINRLTQSINEILNIPNRNTIDGYSRYRLAANLAEDIDDCVKVLAFVGGTASVPAGLRSKNDYLTEARNIAATIPVFVTITRGAENDPERRILSAFQRAVGNVGFRTGDANSPYVLQVTLALSEVQLPNQTNKFARYEITANLIQRSTNQGVIPAYSINGREGHLNLSEAQQRAVRAAETKINNEFRGELEDHLSSIR